MSNDNTPYHEAARDFADRLEESDVKRLGNLALLLSSIAAAGTRAETMQAIQYLAACADYALAEFAKTRGEQQ